MTNINALLWVAWEFSAETIQGAIQKPTLQQREVMRLTHILQKTQNWAYSGLENGQTTKQVRNIYDYQFLYFYIFLYTKISAHKICPNCAGKQVWFPLWLSDATQHPAWSQAFCKSCLGRMSDLHSMSWAAGRRVKVSCRRILEDTSSLAKLVTGVLAVPENKICMSVTLTGNRSTGFWEIMRKMTRFPCSTSSWKTAFVFTFCQVAQWQTNHLHHCIQICSTCYCLLSCGISLAMYFASLMRW